jgi:Zn2+/Cd2+-exporting ATPase
MDGMGETATFLIEGIDCANCARSLEKGVAQLEGVESCVLNATTGRMRVQGRATRDTIVERVRALGYDVADKQPQLPPPSSKMGTLSAFLQFMWQRSDTRLALLGAVLILPGVVVDELLHLSHPLAALTSVTSIGALIAAGLPIARSAVRSLLMQRDITINMLMSIAAVGAVIIGAYTEAGMVMVLFAIGEALEGYTTGRARDSIRSLMGVVPEEATLIRRGSDAPGEMENGGEACGCSSGDGDGDGTCASAPTVQPGTDGPVHPRRVPVEHLRVGDVIMVRPGERIPMDGQVVAGASSVNQAPITGESRLVEKLSGSDVFASSINGEGTLEIEVTHLAADNTISRLIRMVEEAQERRAPVQRFVDQFARFYTPAVVVLALLIATGPPLLFGQPFWNPDATTTGWLYRALAVLVVACPCALVISTPVSIISAIGNASRHGVLIKGGASLETLSRVSTMVFDKTGTLTEGRPSVITVRSARCEAPHHAATPPALPETEWCRECGEVLALASTIEQQSEHPIARAILHESVVRRVHQTYPAARMVTAMAGQGVSGYVGEQQVMIGSHRYFDAHIPHPPTHCQEAHHEAEQGYTTIMVGAGTTYLGKITLSDRVRNSSREALALLKRLGVTDLVMLTGDNAHTARMVGEQVGVTEVRAELLPEDKVAAVRELKQNGGTVAMVGDGINDAPALATADVGIAIGVAYGGTAQAMETADLSLMSDDLRRLPFAVRLSHATMRTIRTNVALSLGIKAGFLVLVLAGLGTMWMAVLADMGTSLLVTLNGMHLLRRPSGEREGEANDRLSRTP